MHNALRPIESLAYRSSFVDSLPADPREDNQTRQVRGACYSRVTPTRVAAPKLLALVPEVCDLLDLSHEPTPSLVEALAGNRVIPGMKPYSACYGGHQFGNWANQLGDGRAITLGEVENARGERWELQLKGAGRTPYSRGAGGRAVLRSSLRELVCSEAMHHLGVPTTRALSLVLTGDMVERDMFYDGNPQLEPGAITCRVAPSFVRFGNFEIHAYRGDHGEGSPFERLLKYVCAQFYPAYAKCTDEDVAALFEEISERTTDMVVHWLRVGFVHGVMNTDNMSILGLTIDYGPYGWLDTFDPGWTPNTTDASSRRYCFARQPAIARWNLERLADALAPLLPRPAELADGLERYDETYAADFCTAYAAKLGLREWRHDDAELLEDLFALMHAAEIDMTGFFRALALLDSERPQPQALDDAFYRADLRQRHAARLERWLQRYAARLRLDGQPPERRLAAMNAANPRFVLRNYLAQQAIDRAEQGDMQMIHQLLEVLRRPYDEQPGCAAFSARRPDWARHRAGCSMLSCSS